MLLYCTRACCHANQVYLYGYDHEPEFVVVQDQQIVYTGCEILAACEALDRALKGIHGICGQHCGVVV